MIPSPVRILQEIVQLFPQNNKFLARSDCRTLDLFKNRLVKGAVDSMVPMVMLRQRSLIRNHVSRLLI